MTPHDYDILSQQVCEYLYKLLHLFVMQQLSLLNKAQHVHPNHLL